MTERLEPTLGRPGHLDVALELTKLWLAETSWYATGNVYDQAKLIGTVFEAYRRQLSEGRVVDPRELDANADEVPAAYTGLDTNNTWDGEEEEDDEEDE
jgi:hypothetical protein